MKNGYGPFRPSTGGLSDVLPLTFSAPARSPAAENASSTETAPFRPSRNAAASALRSFLRAYECRRNESQIFVQLPHALAA